MNCVRPSLLAFLTLALLASGCAEVTRPTPAGPEVDAAQLEAAARHPFLTWSGERTSRVFLRLLARLPRVHGRTYPFLGFAWWVTETGQVAVENVWRPSPAYDAGLKRGDVIVAVNNWPLPTQAETWDNLIRATRAAFRDWLFFVPIDRYDRRYRGRTTYRYVYLMMPGELITAMMIDLKHLHLEAQGRYLTGPVELMVSRDGHNRLITLYPQHLPAEYALLIQSTGRQINAYAAPGKVILTHRLVNFCLNDDELALVVGHELAHQAQGHLMRGAAHRQLGLMVGEAITAACTLSLGSLLDWKQSNVSPDVRRVSHQAVVSAFSRDDELEADAFGLWYAYQAGYDPDKALAFLERLAAVDDRDPFMKTDFLDSHPAPLERLARLKKIARYYQAGRSAEVLVQAEGPALPEP
jgi:Zn-dependent protease with chaperone function